MKTNHVVGVDIGGSHITAARVDIAAKTILDNSLVRKSVDPHAPAAAIINSWSETIQQVAQVFNGEPYHIGIAMPGPFDYQNGISLIKGFNKYEALYGLNVKELLAQQLRITPASIRLKNDAAAFLQGEIFCGAATGYQKAVGLTLGTGLGSAHVKEDDTEECAVNVSPLHEGRAEDYISIRWFLQRYATLTGQIPTNVQFIAARVGEDTQAAQVFREFAANLSLVLQRFIATEQPDVVVIGGGIANAFDLFYPAVRGQLGADNKVPIVRSLLGEKAAMAGAAVRWTVQA